MTIPTNFDELGDDFLKSCGSAFLGTTMKIKGGDEGEICYRGRHIFMGYWKS